MVRTACRSFNRRVFKSDLVGRVLGDFVACRANLATRFSNPSYRIRIGHGPSEFLNTKAGVTSTLMNVKRVAFVSCHSCVDPSSGAALATLDLLELLATKFEPKSARPRKEIAMFTPPTEYPPGTDGR